MRHKISLTFVATLLLSVFGINTAFATWCGQLTATKKVPEIEWSSNSSADYTARMQKLTTAAQSCPSSGSPASESLNNQLAYFESLCNASASGQASTNIPSSTDIATNGNYQPTYGDMCRLGYNCLFQTFSTNPTSMIVTSDQHGHLGNPAPGNSNQFCSSSTNLFNLSYPNGNAPNASATCPVTAPLYTSSSTTGSVCSACSSGTPQYIAASNTCAACATNTPVYTASSNTCAACPTSAPNYTGSACIACTGGTFSNGQCNCPAPLVYNSTSDSCGCTDPNATLSGSACVCNSGYYLPAGASACAAIPPCPIAYSSWSGTACVCNTGYTMNGNGTHCNPVSCPANSTPSESTCECNSGYAMVNGACVASPLSPPPPSTGGPETTVGTGGTGGTGTSGLTCTNPAATIINGQCVTTPQYSCTGSATLSGNQCVSSPVGGVCTSPATQSGSQCVTPAIATCAESATYNASANECVSPQKSKLTAAQCSAAYGSLANLKVRVFELSAVSRVCETKCPTGQNKNTVGTALETATYCCALLNGSACKAL